MIDAVISQLHTAHLNDDSVEMVESPSHVLMAFNTETLPLQYFSHVSDCSVYCASGTIIMK